MKKSTGYMLLFAVLCSITMQQCYYDNAEDLYPMPAIDSTDSNAVVSFKDDIQPFIENSCATSPSCHATGSNNPVLLTHEEIANRAPKIKLRAIEDKDMPPSGPANQANLDKLQEWIDNGTPDN